MKNLLLFLILIYTTQINAQTTYYVNQQTGNDTNSGTSDTTPFETFDKAEGEVMPGDTILIMGEYHNDSYNPSYTFTSPDDAHLWHAENTIRIHNLHGSAGAYITIKAYDGNTIVKGDGANIFRVTSSSYLRIEGLEMEGEVDRIPIATALAMQFVYIDANTVANPNDPTAAEIRYRDQDCISNCTAGAVVDGEIYSNLSGLSVNRASYTDTRGLYFSNVHHIDIIGNNIHHTPGNGFRVSDCEDINIIGNEVHNCSRKSYSGTHGMVITKATSTRTTDDYRIYILKNKVHHNYNEIYSWAPTKTIITPHIDEGKGISLQRNETTYNNDGSIKVNWEHGKILIANNISYYNGFSGVHSNDGNRIDMINNTCYFNSYTKSITNAPATGVGNNIGISAQGGSNIRILNNISVIDSDLTRSAISSNLTAAEGLVVRDNIIYGTNGAISEDGDIVAVQVNTMMTDPLFVDATNFDFHLQASSPAIDVVGVTESPIEDYDATPRDATPDLGALEYQVPVPVELLSFNAILQNNKEVLLEWITLSEINNDYFTIEKSRNAMDWEILGKVQGQVNSIQMEKYHFIDESPKAGNNYYRLKQTDIDGTFSYAPIRAVYIESEPLNISPNPANDFVRIERNNNDEFHIINAQGKEVSNNVRIIRESEEEITLDLQLLAKGLYYIFLGDQSGELIKL